MNSTSDTSNANGTNSNSVRMATRTDVPFILKMIRELAAYERAASDVHATPELLERWLFDEPAAECLIATIDDVPRGIALFYTAFSTWEAMPGIFLEDLVVEQDVRNAGLGHLLLSELARIALARGYVRIEWNCLNWNEPSLDFYKRLGAQANPEWLPHRLPLEQIEALAKKHAADT